MKVSALTLLCLLIAANEAKVFERCELAKLLKERGMDGYHGYPLGNWICMANYESGYNSRAVGQNSNSRDYGIFQINSRWWCDNHQVNQPTANGCNANCNSFTDDNISDDIECAKRIVLDPRGMNAWVAWRNHCRGRDLSQWTRGCKI